MERKKVTKVRTAQLLEALGKATGVPEEDIRLVLSSLADVVGEHLNAGRVVKIDRFGEFYKYERHQAQQQVTKLQGETKTFESKNIVVSFSKSRRLKEILR